MDTKNVDANSFNTIKDVPLQNALAPDETNNRVSSSQNIGSGVDLRSGNIIVRDETDTRIMMGKLPDGNYGLVITKPGYDISEVFS